MSVELSTNVITVLVYCGVPFLMFVGYAAYRGLENISDGLERKAIRKKAQRLLDRPSASYSREWRLPAPESCTLFYGMEDSQGHPFRLGLLQLLADRILTMEVTFEDPDLTPGYFGARETVLRKGPVSAERLEGSLAAIYRLWESLPDPKTIRSLAQEAKQRYGSLTDFTENEVKPRLVEAGLYTRNEYRYRINSPPSSYMTGSRADSSWNESETQVVTNYLLTPEGEVRRDELESRMGAVLRRLQQEKPDWIEDKPQQALMAAVVAVAIGQPKPAEKDEMELIGREAETESVPAKIAAEGSATYSYEPVWIDWTIFDNLERTYAAIGTGWDNAEQSSGGNEGDSGDSSDGGDFGGGGE